MYFDFLDLYIDPHALAALVITTRNRTYNIVLVENLHSDDTISIGFSGFSRISGCFYVNWISSIFLFNKRSIVPIETLAV